MFKKADDFENNEKRADDKVIDSAFKSGGEFDDEFEDEYSEFDKDSQDEVYAQDFEFVDTEDEEGLWQMDETSVTEETEDTTKLGRLKKKIRSNIVNYAVVTLVSCIAVVACVGILVHLGKKDDNKQQQSVQNENQSEKSGKSGNIHWEFTEENALVISGSGEMNSYSKYGEAEWKEYLGKAEKIEIKGGVTKIGDNAFNGCKAHELIVGDGVVSIGKLAFANCENITKVSLPDSLETVEDSAFYGCSFLKEVHISENTKSISDNAFDRCHAEFKIDAPEGSRGAEIEPKHLGEHSEIEVAEYEDDSNVSDRGSCGEDCMWVLYNDNSLVISGSGAMHDYEKISDAPWGSAANNDSGKKSYIIKSVSVKSGVSYIGANAFNGCDELEKVEIEDGVKEIGESAFSDCGSLKEVTVPKSVEKISADAFDGHAKGMKIRGESRSYARIYALMNFIRFEKK